LIFLDIFYIKAEEIINFNQKICTVPSKYLDEFVTNRFSGYELDRKDKGDDKKDNAVSKNNNFSVINAQKSLIGQYKDNFLSRENEYVPIKVVLPEIYQEIDVGGLPKGWTQKIDAKGRVYYVNNELQKTQMRHPKLPKKKVNLKILT
jgi:hypothetical protein